MEINVVNRYCKVRRIRSTYSNDRGTLFTVKNQPEGFIEFESLTEEGLFLLLDHDPNCTNIESQPVKIKNETGKGNPYVPDAWARFKDGTESIFDVKHQSFFDSIKNNPKKAIKWEARKKCVKTYCHKNQLLYQIVTSEEIFGNRLNNVQVFRKNRTEPKLLNQIKPLIETILKNNGGLTRIDLAIEVSDLLKIDIKEVIPSIDHLIFLDFFQLDFNVKITDNTVLLLKESNVSKLLPLYKHFMKLKNFNTQKNSNVISFTSDGKEPDSDSKNLREFYTLSKKIQLEISRKIKLLKIFNVEDVSVHDIIKFAKENGICKSSLYNWKNKYEQSGWTGLIPNYSERGRKKGFKPEVEDLVQKIIEEKYLTSIQPSIMGCYRFLMYYCEKNNLRSPSYNTFRLRIQDISNRKVVLRRRGRKVLRDQFKSLNGQYPFGLHPLDIVEFDHTILDIMLVDRIDRKSIGRPVLTIAIDVYSRICIPLSISS